MGKPNFLGEVIDTIAYLKDTQGSPVDRILDCMISNKSVPLQNASTKIKDALTIGVKYGVLKKTPKGKFKLSISPTEYALCKNLKGGSKLALPVREVRRRRGKRRRSRRRRSRRGRRRAGTPYSTEDEKDPDYEPSDYVVYKEMQKKQTRPINIKELRRKRPGVQAVKRKNTNQLYDSARLGINAADLEPMDRSRRRRKGGRRRRRRGRRRSNFEAADADLGAQTGDSDDDFTAFDDSSMDEDETSTKQSKEVPTSQQNTNCHMCEENFPEGPRQSSR